MWFQQDYNEKDMFEGAEVTFGERYDNILYIVYILRTVCNLLKYDIAWQLKAHKSLCLSLTKTAVRN